MKWVVAGLAALLGLGSGHANRVQIHVSPVSSLADEPVHIRATGLKPHALTTVRLSATDANGERWHSGARFRADAHGVIDLDHAKALSGSYRGIWGMGLVAELTAKAPPTGYRFGWGSRATFRVTAGKVARTFERVYRSRPLRDELHTVADSGFYGEYFAPASGPAAPAVLLLGGSEGGLPVGPLSHFLAERGFPTLALAYFRAPGLPATPASIPLEYFANALRWLRAQPEVASRVAVIGVSLGTDPAELLGVHYPDLVQAVVASVPSNVSLCAGLLAPQDSGSMWTFEGKAVPCTSVFNDPYPQDDPAAVIPVEAVKGPLFLVCGGLDHSWISCIYSYAIMDRLLAFHHPYQDALYAYPRASHSVGSLLPYYPFAPRTVRVVADERGRENLWPKLLDFLSRGARGRGGT